MRFRNGLLTLAVIVLVPALALTGCGSKAAKEGATPEHHEGDGHDHGAGGESEHEHEHLTAADIEMPQDFDAAIIRIKACQATLVTALQGKDLHDAHKPVDELTILFDEMMPLAKKSGIDRQHWKEVNGLVDAMKDKLEVVHEAVEHHSEGTVAAPQNDQEIARLEEIGKAPRSAAE